MDSRTLSGLGGGRSEGRILYVMRGRTKAGVIRVFSMAELAIILAVYNEAENLPSLVEALEGLGEDLEIVVVDDNSPDGTAHIAHQLSDEYGNLTLVQRPAKLGLGSALRDGMAAALTGEARYILTMDGDLSHDPADAPLLLDAMRKERADLVQGSRYMPGGEIRNWSLGRRALSRCANQLFHWGTGGPRESTTNFRVLSRRGASLVLDRARGNGYEFVPEVMLLALASGLRVVEVPITFTDRERGRSKLGKSQAVGHILHTLAGIVQYRLGLGRFSSRRARKHRASN